MQAWFCNKNVRPLDFSMQAKVARKREGNVNNDLDTKCCINYNYVFAYSFLNFPLKIY